MAMTTKSKGAPEGTKDEVTGSEATQALAKRAEGTMRRAGRFAKDHPGATLAAVVAAGALIEVEVAAGAALGIGAAFLVLRERGRDLGKDLRSWWQRARVMVTSSAPANDAGAAPPAPQHG
jgi:hypothetical protein